MVCAKTNGEEGIGVSIDGVDRTSSTCIVDDLEPQDVETDRRKTLGHMSPKYKSTEDHKEH